MKLNFLKQFEIKSGREEKFVLNIYNMYVWVDPG